MFISREIYAEQIESCKTFPVVTITGPRQSGKSTLLKNGFPEKEFPIQKNPDSVESGF
jgi:predicted AAA+ superfamily ATPase